MEEILFMADRNFKAHPPAWRPPPPHLEAAAAYHIIVSICQMMAMLWAKCPGPARSYMVFYNRHEPSSSTILTVPPSPLCHL